MRAEIEIRHQGLSVAEVRNLLERHFGAHNPDALKDSPTYKDHADLLADNFVFIRTDRNSRMIFLHRSRDTLQATVEPVGDKITKSCEFVWDGTRKALTRQSPKLNRMELVDDISKKEFLSATPISLTSEIMRRETRTPLIALGFLLLYYVAGFIWFAKQYGVTFLSGAIAPLAAAIAAVLIAIFEARKGGLRWS